MPHKTKRKCSCSCCVFGDESEPVEDCQLGMKDHGPRDNCKLHVCTKARIGTKKNPREIYFFYDATPGDDPDICWGFKVGSYEELRKQLCEIRGLRPC